MKARRAQVIDLNIIFRKRNMFFLTDFFKEKHPATFCTTPSQDNYVIKRLQEYGYRTVVMGGTIYVFNQEELRDYK